MSKTGLSSTKNQSQLISYLSNNRAAIVSQRRQVHTHAEINLVRQVSSFCGIANKLTQGEYSRRSYLTETNRNFSCEETASSAYAARLGCII